MRSRRSNLVLLLLGLILFVPLLSLMPRSRHPAPAPQDGDEPLPTDLEFHWSRQFLPQTPAWTDQPLVQADAAPIPLVAGDLVLVASARTDSLQAFDIETGQERWHFPTNGPIRFAPAVWHDWVYLGSDDGFLYCLELATGELVWKKRGGPSSRMILGNERLISTWPVRGAPVVAEEHANAEREATVYFAAGVWPFMGIFLRAVDAKTGADVWTNDGDGSQFILQPHQTQAFAGIAPQGQLVVADNRLLVPGGRSVAACYDRHTGRQLHYQLANNSKRGGGPEVRVHGNCYINGVGAFSLENGQFLGSVGEFTVGRGNLLYSWTANRCQTLQLPASMAEEPVSPGKTKAVLAPQAWKPVELALSAVPPINALLLTRAALVAATSGQVLAYQLPLPSGQARPVWQTRIPGEPKHLTVGAEHLVVTTREGWIYCFGSGKSTPKSYPLPTMEVGQRDNWTAKAAEILARSKIRDGYCLVWGAGSGRLVAELLRQSQLKLVVVEADPEHAQALREQLLNFRNLGNRAAVLCTAGEPLRLPPYLASLITSETPVDPGTKRGLAFLREVFPSLRPYGGVAQFLRAHSTVKDSSTLRLVNTNTSSDLAQAQEILSNDWVQISRPGALPGAADWTHEHGDAANTRVANDTRVKAPLGLLWFGGPPNDGILPRHGHGPQPQVVAGRLIIEGVDKLRAIDVYTGRLLWEKALPGLGAAYDNLAHQTGANSSGTNYIALSDGIYVILGGDCLRLDPETGRVMIRFGVPPPLFDPRDPPTWSHLSVCDNYLIAMVNPPFKEGKGKPRVSSSSRYLVVLNRHTGKLLWQRQAREGFRHNTLCAGNGRLFVIDRASVDFRNLFKKKPDAKTQPSVVYALQLATGKEMWSQTSTPTFDVFGTWLSYSTAFDILVESGRVARDTLSDEARGMRAYNAKTGKVLWFHADYVGPAMLHGDRVLKDGSACDLRTGEPYRRPDPITGELTEWTWSRTYGCNTPLASEHLLTFRSGAAGYYDLCNEGGTGNFGGFRSGCTNNLIVADGVLSAPDYTRTCTCSYQQQASLALVPDLDGEMWTFQGKREVKGEVKRLGILLGAPGNRKADNGTLWLEYPPVSDLSPHLPVRIEPEGVTYFRHHLSQVNGAWQAASGARGLTSLTIPLRQGVKKPARASTYQVRLVFVEPDGLPEGERFFDVALQGRTVLRNLDVSAAAGGPNHMVIEEFLGIAADGELKITLTPSQGTGGHLPVLCGVEVVAE